MQRRKIPSLITTRCAGWHRAGGIHPRRRANRCPDNRDLDHPCRPRRRHQMEGPGTASNAAPALAILRALRQDGSRPRSQKQDLSGSRKSGSQWTRRWRKADSNSQSRVASRYRHVMPWIVDRRHYVPSAAAIACPAPPRTALSFAQGLERNLLWQRRSAVTRA
jgi:hypothetical protein